MLVDLEEKFVHMLTKNKKEFYRLAYSFVKNEQDSLDVISDSIYKALIGLKNVKNPDFLKTWFYRIVINESNSLLRRKKVDAYNFIEVEKFNTSIKKIDREDIMDLYKGIDKLEEKYRTVILLRYARNMQFKEIADILEININTVKTRHKRGLDKLKKIMGGKLYE